MNVLVLFDIDGTLTKGSKVHWMAFSEGFKKVYGVDTNISIINYDGMTDQQIIIEALKKKGLNDEVIESGLHECMKAMVDSFHRKADTEEITVLSGVRELLEELGRRRTLMGLVTGNLEPIARGKLRRANLNHYFKVGGFGSDDLSRTNLVKLAIRRAEENLAFRFDDNVVLVGDTPLDMKAGKEAKVKTIGVATGIYSKEQLESANADFVFESLKDTKRILKVMLCR